MTIADKLAHLAKNMKKLYDAGYAQGHRHTNPRLIKTETYELSFSEWVIGDGGGEIVIPHTLGEMPDTVIILPSHRNWSGMDQVDDVYYDKKVIVSLVRGRSDMSDHANMAAEYYSEGSYQFETLSIPGEGRDILSFNDKAVTVTLPEGYALAPESKESCSELSYTVLVTKGI